jgi:uncharacterized protein YceK
LKITIFAVIVQISIVVNKCNSVMTYTIKIDSKTRKAKSIVNMLKELSAGLSISYISTEDLPEESGKY